MAQAPGTVVEHLSEGLLIVDPADQLIYWNPAALKIYGFASASEAIRRLPELPEIFELSTLDGEILPTDQWPLARILRGETVEDLELRVRCRAPAWTRIFRYSGSRVHYAGHRALGFLTVNDVTERKQTEIELERVNRLNIARSLINQAIVRHTHRNSLFQQVCRVLVEQGGFRMAWVGWHSSRTHRMVRVASWGEQTGYPASFPIRRAGKVCGELSVYATEVGFFRDQEVALLEEAAADVSFALDHLASERARRRAQESAERSRHFTDAMIDSLPGIFYFYDRPGQMLRWNRNFAAASGYTDEEISRMHPLDFFRGEDRERVAKEIDTVFERGESSVEAAFSSKDGSSRCYLFTGKRIAVDGVNCLVGMGIDIATRKAAEAATEQYARRLQATSHRLLTVQESERRTLARELHDAVGQELTALSLNLTIIDGALPAATPPKVRERLEDSQELLEETTRHLRNIMTELRPPGLDELGLLAALQEHVTQVARRSEITLSVSGVEPQPRLAPTEEIALFRIVQEALNNIVKHSRAAVAAVSLRQHSDRVELTITDDGVGFDTAGKPIMGGYGMGTTTMRERAEAIGATWQLLSSPGEGTRIIVELSWPVPAAQ